MSAARPSNQRELVFCHSCENEWYRDEHGLECPECHSDVVEIIEADHDPREEMHESDELDTQHPGRSLFGTDPSEMPADPSGSGIRVMHSPNGMIWQGSFQSSSRSPEEGQRQENTNLGAQDLISRMFQAIGGMTPDEAIRHGQQRSPGSEQPPPSSTGSPPPVPTSTRPEVSLQSEAPQVPSSTRPDMPNQEHQSRTFQFGPFSGRITSFSSTTRVYGDGRVIQSRQTAPEGHPLAHDPDMMGMFGNILGLMNQSQPSEGRTRMMFTTNNMPAAGGVAMASPLHTILSSLGMPMMGGPHGSTRAGDYVFTDEDLDRLMSHFQAQSTQSNAPGPATEAAITALPRKNLTKEMIGDDRDTADCGICLADCEGGEEVTELPCKHWFHFDCVKHWLESHDSCPTCRRGIMPKEGGDDRPRDTGETPRHWQMPSLSRSNTHESTEERRAPGGGDAAGTDASASTSRPGLSPRTSRTHRWSRSRSPQTSSQTESGTGGGTGLGSSIADGFRNGIREWMGRHFHASEQAGATADTSSGGAAPVSGAGASRGRSSIGNESRHPSTQQSGHQGLDNPEVD